MAKYQGISVNFSFFLTASIILSATSLEFNVLTHLEESRQQNFRRSSSSNLPRIDVIEHSGGLNEVRANDCCVNSVRAEHLQLQPQSFIESDGRKLARAIIDKFGNSDVAGHRRY